MAMILNLFRIYLNPIIVFMWRCFRRSLEKQAELRNQQEMENVYLTELNRVQNLIFVKSTGASWDIFTLGGYRDIKHFAESADIPYGKEEKAAICAGFKGVSDISLYLRSLIYRHNDTLAKKAK